MVAQDQGVLPEGKPALHDQGHAAVPTCLRHVEETLILVSGPGAGSLVSPRNMSDGRIPPRSGSGHEWPPCPRSVERFSCHLAHQLPGDSGHVSGRFSALISLLDGSPWEIPVRGSLTMPRA